jgi:serine protein kinase
VRFSWRHTFQPHDRLREAIEKKLMADLKNVVKTTTSSRTPDPEQQKRVNEVVPG